MMEVEEGEVPDSGSEKVTDLCAGDYHIPCKLRRDVPEIGTSNVTTEQNNDDFKKLAASFRNNEQKPNSICSNVSQEQLVTTELHISDMKKSRSEMDNGQDVESYDYRKRQGFRMKDELVKNENSIGNRPQPEPNEKIKHSNGQESRKRKLSASSKKTAVKQRLLKVLDVTIDNTDEEIAKDIANKLYEPKQFLISRVIEVLGKALAVKYYSETRDLEASGGLIVLDGSRRRTSGGVFFHLVRTSSDIPLDKIRDVFKRNTKAEREYKENRKALYETKKYGNEKLDDTETKPPSLLSRLEVGFHELTIGKYN